MLKLNAWIKRFSIPILCGAGILIALATAFSHIFSVKIVADVCFIAAFVLSGVPILLRAIQALRFKTVSIELLVSIAAIGACVIGEFNESAIVTFLFQFGSFLEQKTMKKTRSAIRALTEMAPTTAWRIIENGAEDAFETEEIDADEVEIGDILLVKAGGKIASDGVVVKGDGYAAEASITGEPIAKHKTVGDTVYAGTILDSGTIQMRATKVGEDTTFAKIIALVEEAQDAKSPVERFIDKFAKYYTPAVIAIAAAVFIFTRNVDTAITVLVLACPGALVIGAPIANVAGIGRGAQEGILLKGGDSIHTFSKTNTVVFDKTGTLTEGVPEVCVQKDYSNKATQALALAASVEKASDHPLANAVIRYAADLPSYEAESVQTIKGCGMDASICGHRVLIGNRKLMEQNGIELTEQVLSDLSEVQNSASIALIAVDGKAEMLLGISDKLKADAKDSISRLKNMGIADIIMLTGDNACTASAIAAQLGITEYRAELLPEDKLTVIRELQSKGRTVTFVGDGINDSPALAAADTGIAMGSGTDVAIDNSDVVLIKSDLKSLVRSLKLSKKAVLTLYENIAIAVGTVVLLLIGLFAGYIHMSIGMLIHEASILVVILNAMRLWVHNKKEN
ncbi:possible cadmium-exporting ATPase [Clostridium sp. CAG:226]|nr:possible cadmium-exporting ATPase [Clostridium sp. CAG:226]